MQLETKISAKFLKEEDEVVNYEQQQSLDALNKHTEDCCEILQPIFQTLIIEMLTLKRESFAKENNHAGSQPVKISSDC